MSVAIHKIKVYPLNDAARKTFKEDIQRLEMYVRYLYHLRGRKCTQKVLDQLKELQAILQQIRDGDYNKNALTYLGHMLDIMQ